MSTVYVLDDIENYSDTQNSIIDAMMDNEPVQVSWQGEVYVIDPVEDDDAYDNLLEILLGDYFEELPEFFEALNEDDEGEYDDDDDDMNDPDGLNMGSPLPFEEYY